MFSLFTHQWCLPVAERLKLQHQGPTFITRESFVFLAVHREKAFYWLSLRRKGGFGDMHMHWKDVAVLAISADCINLLLLWVLTIQEMIIVINNFPSPFVLLCHTSPLFLPYSESVSRIPHVCPLHMCRLLRAHLTLCKNCTWVNSVHIYWLVLHYGELTDWIT